MRDVLGRIWAVIGRIADVIRMIIITAFCGLLIVAIWWDWDATGVTIVDRFVLSVAAIASLVFIWNWTWQRTKKDDKDPDDNAI